MDPFFFLMAGRGRRGGGGRKKKAKKPKENWYERLTVDELKQICRAAKLAVKGTKKIIIERLLESDSTRKYGREGMWGTNMNSLKGECADRNLVQSGTKLTLVLRILQKDNDTNPEATAAATKRPPPPPDVAAAAKKKRKPAKPDLDKIYDRVQKKIESVKQKKYQSHYGSKTHAPDVYSFTEGLIRNECFDKGYAESDPLFALSIAKSALVSLTDNFYMMQRPGYDEDYFTCIANDLTKIINKAKPHMNDDAIADSISWIESLEAQLEPYALAADYNDFKIRYFPRVVATLKGWLIEQTKETTSSLNHCEDEKTPEDVLKMNSVAAAAAGSESSSLDKKLPSNGDGLKMNSAPSAGSESSSLDEKLPSNGDSLKMNSAAAAGSESSSLDKKLPINGDGLKMNSAAATTESSCLDKKLSSNGDGLKMNSATASESSCLDKKLPSNGTVANVATRDDGDTRVTAEMSDISVKPSEDRYFASNEAAAKIVITDTYNDNVKGTVMKTNTTRTFDIVGLQDDHPPLKHVIRFTQAPDVEIFQYEFCKP